MSDNLTQKITDYLHDKLRYHEPIPDKEVVLAELNVESSELQKRTETHPFLFKLVSELCLEIKSELQITYDNKAIKPTELSADEMSYLIASAWLAVAARNNDEPPPAAAGAMRS